MKVAIFGRSTIDNTSEHIQFLFHKLNEYKTEILIYEPFYNFIKQKMQINGSIKTFKTHDELVGNVDYMFSIGGDGTFLETLTYVRDSGIPIIGINTGRLGFLANIAKTEINKAIESLLHKKIKIEKRSLITVTSKSKLFGEVNYGLNEITILKKDTSSLITINAYINGDFLNSYFADGLIVATPTGSTAYSLSCGGPLVMPCSQNFIITPIASHNLNVRPLVISDDSIITLKVEGRNSNYLVSLDSRSEVIDSSIELTLKKADFSANLIQLENQNFFNTIRNKLLWGLDKRNY
ncbi:MAG: NAD kinase [Bacteroidetes bacterium RIFCSPLOWO2_12_FULL_35_15]|nr:MAG: NAD kinase [Bacteroidetes bacterium RIFCSPLOWO2_12_FULL_35_15]